MFCAVLLGSRYSSVSAPLKILFWYLASTSVIFVCSNILAERIINNLFLYHFFTAFNFCFLFLYLQLVYNFFKSRFLIISVCVVIVCLCILNTFIFEPISSLDINSFILTHSILVFFSLWGLVKSIRNQKLIETLGYHDLIFTFGIFVYSAPSIIIYSYFKYMNHFGQRISNKVWFLQDDILIIKYCCFIIACIICIKKK